MKNPRTSPGWFLAAALAAVLSVTAVHATNVTYYVDSAAGADTNSGTSTAAPWQSLAKINATTFTQGDQILLKRGGAWAGQLYPKGSGVSGNPIKLGAYGTGAAPVVAGGSLAAGAAVYLYNQSYWTIENLEVTNNSGTDNTGTATTGGVPRYGILVEADVERYGITIRNNYVHHVNGAFNCTTLDPHINGGISVHAMGWSGKFNGVTVQDNAVDLCGRSGIVVWQDRYFNTDQLVLDRTKMGTALLVDGNYVTDSDGDGILVYGFVGSTIQNNVSDGAGLKSIAGFNVNASAGIWPTRAADTVMQFNESSGCHTNDYDGQGFDVDLGNDNTLVQYNYSHGNQGGFLLMMGGYNSNLTVRYNISASEGTAKGVFTFSWGTPTGLKIYNNTVYVGAGDGAVNLFYQEGDAAAIDYSFTNNLIYNLGSGDYYLPTVAGVKYGTFDHNLFYGNHPSGEPADANKLTSNPLFVSVGGSVDGYKLQSTSPAIGSGVVIASNGGSDFWGNVVYTYGAPNRGAFNGYATPGSFVDACDNFTKTYSHSSNVGLDTTNPTYFSGDGSRFKRSSTATGSAVYNVAGSASFSAKIYKFSNSDLTKVKFYSSPTGTTWTLVTSSYTTPTATAGGWYATTFTPAAVLPAGTSYLKVEFSDTLYAYSPQLGQITITLN